MSEPELHNFNENPPPRQSKEKYRREGVRKSARAHYKPLEYWRGEKLLYGRNPTPGLVHVHVPPIKEIVRIPKEEAEPLAGKRKRARSKSKAIEEDKRIRIVHGVENPEEGWDDETESSAVVLDLRTGDEVERRILFYIFFPRGLLNFCLRNRNDS